MLSVDTKNLHPSTGLCLEALQFLQARAHFSNILDVGCGNGILSVVAAHAWEASVLAVDIAPGAVEETKANIAAYGLESRVTAIRGDGLDDNQVKIRAPYDLIIGNLLAELLLRLAPDIKRCLAPGGYVLLSGGLEWMAEGVEQAYTDLGFEIIKKFVNSPWRAWLCRHRTATQKIPVS